MTKDDEIMLKYDEQSTEYQMAEIRQHKLERMQKVLEEACRIWRNIYPEESLHISFYPNLLMYFSLDKDNQKLVEKTILEKKHDKV